MNGLELRRALEQLDTSVLLNYKVLIGVDGRWMELESITTDPSLKTIDLTHEGGEADENWEQT